MSSYQNYPPIPRAPGSRPPTGDYQVVVEYANEGEAKPPTVVDVRTTVYRTRDAALEAARRAAFEYHPPDPWSPQGRTVFADGPDGFLTVIQGAVSVFHFSSRVVRRVDKPVEDR